MMKNHIIYILFFMLPIHTALCAPVYKHIDKHGNVVYSDEPVAGSEEVKLKPLTTYKSEPEFINPNVQKPKEEIEKRTVKSYTLSFAKPKNEQVIGYDQQVVNVTVKVEPKLASNDRVKLFVNGSLYGSPQTSPNFAIKDLPRGAHTLRAEIYEEKGKKSKGKTDTITIYVKKPIAKTSQNNSGQIQFTQQAAKL